MPQSECMLCMVTWDPLNMEMLDFFKYASEFCSGRLMLQKIVQLKTCEVYHYNMKINYEDFYYRFVVGIVGCIIKCVFFHVAILYASNRSEFHER